MRRFFTGLLVAGCLLYLPGAAQAEVRSLDRALATVQILQDMEASPVEQAAVLPYVWDRHHAGFSGRALFRLSFDGVNLPAGPWGLFIERLGNAYEVRLNGRVLDRDGDLERFNGADAGQMPRLIDLPEGSLQAENTLEIRIRVDVGRHGGLAPVLIGPYEEVSVRHHQAYLLRNTGTLLVVVFSVLVGLTALALWSTQTRIDSQGAVRRDPLYLYAALAELAWALRVGNSHIENPPLSWPWWGVLPVLALGIWGVCMTFFCMELAEARRTPLNQLFRRWLLALLVLAPLAAVASLGFGQQPVLTLWYAMLGLSFLVFGIWFLRDAVRQPLAMPRLVALAVLVNVMVGLRDLYVFRIDPSYPSNSLMYYSSALFGLTLGYVVIARFRSATTQARELMDTLASRVTQREEELHSSYQRLEGLAREQERTAERTRILRDMHDGVGSHISAAIRQLQSGRASQEDVLQTLRESMDQLKLTIDAMHLPQGDITALLANLRYRLAPRLAASDIELQWDVDLIEPVKRLDAQAMRHLQFMVFEALSNVLQHAHASCLRIEARGDAEGVRLRIGDNGRGFDTSEPPRKGLASLYERAQALGATLHLESAPGRTVVNIFVPIA